MSKNRRLIYQINMARHSMMKAMNNRCRSELGISVSQLTALMAINEKNNCLMKDLAGVLMLDKSAITGLAKRMLENGLITKKQWKQDSRVSRLALTGKGRSVLKEGKLLIAEANQVMAGDFSAKELDTVSRYLTHLTNTFSGRK